VPDPGRLPDLAGMTADELDQARRDLRVSLALARPDSPVRAPILAQIIAIDAELAEQSVRRAEK
jgi:hypothetical protein